MNRYVDCDEKFVEVFLQVLEERFPMYGNLKFKLIFDLKKKVNKGKICLGGISLATDKIKYFTKDNVAIEGYDYVMILDRKAWELASEEDRKRIISHELRHVFIDDKGKLKILPHDISDFVAEQMLNQDSPDWGIKLSTLVNDIYEQEKEMQKTNKD